MLKWLLVVLLLVLVTGVLREGLARTLRFGHLPGDLHFRVRGRLYHLPFTTTVLVSLVGWMILRSL